MENTDLKVIKNKDGKPYTIRVDRRRFFFPDEYLRFRKELRDKHKFLFDFLINTGARINEALHIRPCDFDFEKNNVRLWKTKTKAKKGETQGKPRTISISSSFSKRMKNFCSNKNTEEYLWKTHYVSINQILKTKLKKINIKDWYNFSTHNIRKTHGMFLKALGIDVGEICVRLGHDYNTYITHYGSADIFLDKDMRQIRDILNDLYMRQRRF